MFLYRDSLTILSKQQWYRVSSIIYFFKYELEIVLRGNQETVLLLKWISAELQLLTCFALHTPPSQQIICDGQTNFLASLILSQFLQNAILASAFYSIFSVIQFYIDQLCIRLSYLCLYYVVS